jgi:hypothetical protein
VVPAISVFLYTRQDNFFRDFEMANISAAALFELAKRLHPAGLLGEAYVPVTVQGETFELRYFTDRGRGEDVEFSFFRSDAQYARRTFIVLRNGKVGTPDQGHVPERDKVQGEMPITTPTGELMNLIHEALSRSAT